MTDSPFIIRLKELIRDLAEDVPYRFAKILEINPGQIDKWINKGSLPSSEHLINIKEKLGVNINWLLTGAGEKYIKPAVGEVRETAQPYGLFTDITDEEKQYIKRLIKIFHTKQDKTVIAIKQNIDAFLDTPNKIKVKKTANDG